MDKNFMTLVGKLFEDSTKRVIKSRKKKTDSKYNGQKKKEFITDYFHMFNLYMTKE